MYEYTYIYMYICWQQSCFNDLLITKLYNLEIMYTLIKNECAAEGYIVYTDISCLSSRLTFTFIGLSQLECNSILQYRFWSIFELFG